MLRPSIAILLLALAGLAFSPFALLWVAALAIAFGTRWLAWRRKSLLIDRF